MMFWKHLCLPQGNARLPFLWREKKNQQLVVKANGEFPMSNIHPVFVPSTATGVVFSWESYWCTIEMEEGEFSTFKVLQKNLTLLAIILDVSFLPLIGLFQMFNMFYSVSAVAEVLLNTPHSQCLFPNTLLIQLGIILSRNCPPT